MGELEDALNRDPEPRRIDFAERVQNEAGDGITITTASGIRIASRPGEARAIMPFGGDLVQDADESWANFLTRCGNTLATGFD